MLHGYKGPCLFFTVVSVLGVFSLYLIKNLSCLCGNVKTTIHKLQSNYKYVPHILKCILKIYAMKTILYANRENYIAEITFKWIMFQMV